jgi:hypothetical protein
MAIWQMLIPFEVATLVVLCAYLIHVVKQARFLKGQEKRIEKAKRLPSLAEKSS